ncbi:type II secretion system protein GspM [Marinobacter sp. VGCF2001]|uniref:type II secretion system protein GspM n=1 Tax=Marinobacter sp. VGCF2001 TaxID=3417189 RepID=UPI003CF0E7AD
MNRVKAGLSAGRQWYDDRPDRERILILLTVCVLVFVAGWELAVAPVEARNSQLNTRFEAVTDTRDSLLSQQESLDRQLANDPSEVLRQRLASRKNRLDRLDQEITETTGQLIAPRDMVVLLRGMLSAQQGLTLDSMQLLAPQPVYAEPEGAAEAAAGNPAQPEPLLYAHDVEMTVRGGYLKVLDYLERLEAMDERLGWLRFDYEAGAWPDGQAIIRVRTLSLEPAWLGV